MRTVLFWLARARYALLVLVLCCVLVPGGAVPAAQATGSTTWAVTSTKDTSTPAAAHCTGTTCPTLRDALVAAHSGDTVSLAGLSGSLTVGSSAPLTITTSLTITGPTTTTLTINGNGIAPTFWLVGNGLAVTINNLTISGGGCSYKPIAVAGGLMAGGGILMTAAMTRSIALTLTSTVVSNNSGLGALETCTWGGGITMDISHGGSGALTLSHSTVAQNSATNGGGILVYDGGVSTSGTANVTLNSSTVLGNMNTAGTGAGIDFDGFATASLTLNGATVSNNTAGSQAGIYLAGGGTPSLSLTNSTIENNTSTSWNSPENISATQHLAIDDASGIWVYASGATMTTINSIVNSNCLADVTLNDGDVLTACPAAAVS